MSARSDAAYGAYFALQVMERRNSGRGFDRNDWARFHEEAQSVAEIVEEQEAAHPREKRKGKKG